MNKRRRGITLVELIVAVILLTVIILAVMSIDTFSRYHLIGSDRRSRLQNELSFALEHMQKNIARGVGNVTNPPIETLANGFRVRVDLRVPPDLSDLAGCTWISYTLSSNTLSCTTGALTETLSRRIVATVSAQQVMPAVPTSGFYVNITDPGTGAPVGGAVVEVGLAGRWDPSTAQSADNPQVAMKTKVYATSASIK